jgi:hypothetical protein
MNRNLLCLLAAAFLTTLLAACSTTATGTAAGSARIRSVDGAADLSRQGTSWEPAHIWQTVRSGDHARTGPNGKIDFSLGKYGGVLTLMPESAIQFEQLGPVNPTSQIVAVINLTEGRVVGDTLKLPPNTRIQVKTRSGVHEIP